MGPDEIVRIAKFVGEGDEASIAGTLAAIECLAGAAGEFDEAARAILSWDTLARATLGHGVLNELLRAAFLAGHFDPRPWTKEGKVEERDEFVLEPKGG